MKSILVALVLGVSLSSANAAFLYTYSGENLSQTNQNPLPAGVTFLSGFVVLDGPLLPNSIYDSDLGFLPLSVSFDAGLDTITSELHVLTKIILKTDANASIDEWWIELDKESAEAGLLFVDSIFFSEHEMRDAIFHCEPLVPPNTSCAGAGGISTVPGTWSITPVPIPAATWLFGSALGLLGWMRRK